MEKFGYRLADENDIAFISQVYNENIAALHGAHRSEDTWRQLLAEKRHIYYIVYNEAPVAWFRLDWEDDILWIGMLQVKPAYHRRGIGSYILTVSEEMAKQKCVKKIGIHTTQDNSSAQGLYLSLGYAVTEIGPCTTADGVERMGYTLEKKMQV